MRTTSNMPTTIAHLVRDDTGTERAVGTLLGATVGTWVIESEVGAKVEHVKDASRQILLGPHLVGIGHATTPLKSHETAKREIAVRDCAANTSKQNKS